MIIIQIILFLYSILLLSVSTVHSDSGKSDLKNDESIENPIKITILYDNYKYTEGTKPDWGFACLVEGAEKKILFDTGAKPETLKVNIEKTGVNIQNVEIVVISHIHWDHIGGLPWVIEQARSFKLYLLKSFSKADTNKYKFDGVEIVKVSEDFTPICKGVVSTGEMGDSIKEQSLILNTKKGLVIITGCSHQGIVNIVKRAKKLFDKKIYMIFGGFHLKGLNNEEARKIVQQMKDLGVINCGPTHCTGDHVIKIFEEVFGKNYIRKGTGRQIDIK